MRATTLFRFKYFVYKLVWAAHHLLDLGRTHPLRVRNLRATEAAADYIEANMPEALGFETQKELIDYALGEVGSPGHYLEFGVADGGTIRFIAGMVPDQQVDGFDSFEGLPEAWSGTGIRGRTFTRSGRLPRVPANVILHKGWFRDTLPRWTEANKGPVAFLHVDCDVYSSTREVLAGLGDRIGQGSVIVFDEYFNYPNWENHEFRAWQEFVKARGVKYEYLAYARNQVAVRVLGAEA
jgi:Macrocin-O-methyltransferase (TylF)